MKELLSESVKKGTNLVLSSHDQQQGMYYHIAYLVSLAMYIRTWVAMYFMLYNSKNAAYMHVDAT